jgi:serine/threonine protein kinase
MLLSSGTKLGHYEILELIGKGGMGEVYRGRDIKLGRDVAIKVLPEEFARDKKRLDRFEQEAKLLAQVNHSNIATLHGLEEHDGQQFIVMELVEGETLAERVARARSPSMRRSYFLDRSRRDWRQRTRKGSSIGT